MLTFTENPAEARDAIGIEVVTPALVDQLAGNIDPQHGYHKGQLGWPPPDGESAAAYVLKWTLGLPADQMNVFIEKPDLDSVCAAALLELERLGRIIGEGVREKVALIDEADRGGRSAPVSLSLAARIDRAAKNARSIIEDEESCPPKP